MRFIYFISHHLEKNRRIKLLIATTVVGMLGYFLYMLFGFAYRPHGYDFTSYLLSTNALLENTNPYLTGSRFSYMYPLFFLILMIPFEWMPYWLANLTWYFLNIFFLALIVYFSVHFASNYIGKKFNELIFSSVLVCLILVPIIQNNLLNGQVNFLVLLFCLLFFKNFNEGKNIQSAIFLSMAISIKLVPAILLLYLLLRKEFKILSFSALFTLTFCMLPVIIVGSEIIDLYKHYFHSFLLPKLVSGEIETRQHIIFSFAGMVKQIFAGGKYFFPIWVLSNIAVLLPILYSERLGYELKKKGNNLNFLIFNQYLIAILLISPKSETHHLIWFLPLVIIFTDKVLHSPKLTPKIALPLLILFYVLIYLGKMNKYAPYYFFSILLLYFILFIEINFPSRLFKRQSTD